MSSDRPIEGLMDTTLDKIKQMVDVNTVVGTPITAPNGTTVIPISKVMYGFVSGGSEFNPKKAENKNLFGGGASAGVTINPIAFIAITKDDVKLLSVSNFKDSQDRAKKRPRRMIFLWMKPRNPAWTIRRYDFAH